MKKRYAFMILLFLIAVVIEGLVYSAWMVQKPASTRPIPLSTLDKNGCLRCHGNETMTTANGSGTTVSLYVDGKAFQNSVHRFYDCTTCHDKNPHIGPSPLTKLSLAESCARCHPYEFQEHQQSIHGKQIASGGGDAATCVDCHSPTGTPHNIQPVLSLESTAFRKNVAVTCAKCHADEKLMKKYGVDAHTVATYEKTFHGKATKLGAYALSDHNQATCTDCHGTHKILGSHDPSSPVARANLAETCARCHEGAGDSYAESWLGHEEATPENFPIVYFVERFFFTLTSSVLTFAVLLVSVQLVGSLARIAKGNYH